MTTSDNTPKDRLPLIAPARPAARHKSSRSEPKFSQDAYRRLNGTMGAFVIASVALCPIPVGMNRTVPWLIWGAITAAAVVAYLFAGYRADPIRRLISRRFWPLFALASLVPFWAVVQALWPVSIAFPAAPDVAALIQHRISAIPSATLLAALRFTSYLLFVFLVVEVSGRTSRATSIAIWIFWSIVVHAVWALISLNLLGDIHIWGADKSAGQGSATGTFVNRNSFASYLAMGAALGFSLLQDHIDNPNQRKARTRGLVFSETMESALIGLGLVIIWLSLLATGSRMGVLAAGIGTIISFLAMRLKKRASTLGVMLLFLCAAAVLGVIGIFATGQDLAWRVFFLERDALFRLDGYSAILAQIAQRPILGYGFDAFRPAFEWSDSSSIGAVAIWDRAHSTYLSHWFELGIFVGSVPILLLGYCLWRAFDLWRHRMHDYALPVAALAVILSQALHSAVDFGLEMPANVVLFLTIIALGVTPRRRSGASGSMTGVD